MAMLKASEVCILTANEAKDLQDAINRKLTSDKAWTLHGDLKVVQGAVQFTYCQALVKLEPYEMPGMGQVMPIGAPPILMRK